MLHLQGYDHETGETMRTHGSKERTILRNSASPTLIATTLTEMDPDKPTFFERISSLLLREPEDREQLMQLLHSAHERKLLDADALSITEGALAASEVSVRDVMVPRAQMEFVDIDDPLDKIIAQVNAPPTRASRSSTTTATTSSASCSPRTCCASAGTEVQPARLAAPGGFHPRIEAAQRPAARIPRLAQPHGDRHRRIRRRQRPDHHRGRARTDRRRHRGRIRLRRDRGQHPPDQFGRFRVKAQTAIEDFNEHFGTTSATTNATPSAA
jgi:hypothetical protein